MKVWLDDERHEPATWVRARTATEAITLLATGGVQEISLDHDLGEDAAGTGYDVLTWIERAVVEHALQPPTIFVHTANPPARIRMLAAVEVIEKLVSASRTDSDTPEKRLAALPPGYVETVVTRCREALGDALEEVILYGSRAYGCPTPESDCDIALIVSEKTWLDGKNQVDLANDINEACDYDPRTSLYVSTHEEIESYRSVSVSMQAHILERGIRLYVSNQVPAPRMVVEPKTHLSIAKTWLEFAEAKIITVSESLARNEERGREPSIIDTEFLFVAACWSFKSVLFAHGIGCADQKLRWNLARLQQLAGLIEPALQPLSAEVACLPWHYDQYRYGYLSDVPEERTEEEVQVALTAARRIYTQCMAAVEAIGRLPKVQQYEADDGLQPKAEGEEP